MNTNAPANFTLHTNGFYRYTNGNAVAFINPAHVMLMRYDAIEDCFLTIVFTDGNTRAYRLDDQTPEQAIHVLLG